jgi:hypothetical protein
MQERFQNGRLLITEWSQVHKASIFNILQPMRTEMEGGKRVRLIAEGLEN